MNRKTVMEGILLQTFSESTVQSHNIGYEDFYLLGYDAMQSVGSQLTIRRNVSLPSSRLKSKLEEQPYFSLQVAFFLGLLFNPDDGGDIFPQNVERL
jgi:hypothetical protein